MINHAAQVPHLDGWLLATEAAAELGVSRQSVNRWIAEGRFEGARRLSGGDRPIYVVPVSEVDRMKVPRDANDAFLPVKYIVVRQHQRSKHGHGDGRVHACPDGLPAKGKPLTAGRTCQRQVDSHPFEVTHTAEFEDRPCRHCRDKC